MRALAAFLARGTRIKLQDVRSAPCWLCRRSLSSGLPQNSASSGGSSSRYIARQQRDPYVKLRRQTASAKNGDDQAQAALPSIYASRAAYKLIQLDDIHGFLRGHSASSRQTPRIIVDLGAAPGGWTQVAVERSHAGAPAPDPATSARSRRAHVFALDILPMDAVAGATVIQGDFLDAQVQADLERSIIGDSPNPSTPGCGTDDAEEDLSDLLLDGSGLVDVVLSDMMAPTTGNPISDTEASLELCRSAMLFAARNLRRPQPTPAKTMFVCKFFGSPAADQFRRQVLERAFERVKVEKGRIGASRKESREAFWVCQGYRGPQAVDVDAMYS
ncbi:unnamed protein product [Tilletia caries]|uniref:rRNA methyltransferase 2, mitochondrial n=1 Tax=Tilletia caries TaxID=13290 RepID=A0ABN7J1V9_9BASI|nr:unnamed protein product [Tilletia caries]